MPCVYTLETTLETEGRPSVNTFLAHSARFSPFGHAQCFRSKRRYDGRKVFVRPTNEGQT